MRKVLVFILALSFQLSIAQTLPTGFAQQEIAQNLDPTDLVIAPDGRIFITIKSGKVFIVENGILLSSPLLDITASVDNSNERGLGHIVLDPNFDVNHYYYIYYTVFGSNFNRISRFTANGNSTLLGSEFVLMNLDNLFASIHNAGDMAFGVDGKLYISVGESGNSANAQVMTTVLGKILRINSDGSIPTDNPFYSSTTGKNQAIYALGLRNPFSLAIQPGTGKIFISDVGQDSWEEVNEIQAGKNYGWPAIEGMRTSQTPPANYKDPVYAYSHGTGCAVVGAAFYNPATVVFPSQYVGKFYFADYCNGFIKCIDPTTFVVQTFATGINRPLAMIAAPDGSMYYLARAGLGDGSNDDNTSTTAGTLWKVFYTGSGAPSISSQPQSTTAVVGDVVNFILSASGTQPLTYQWKINGSPVAGATSSSFSFTVTDLLADNGKQFTCVVTNGSGSATSSAAVLTVSTNTRPVPVISVTLPGGNTLYQAGQTLQFSGSAMDAEDGPLPVGSLTWKIDFHHNVHTHPGLPATSGIASGSFDIPKLGETSDDVWYRVLLTATDNQGFSNTVYQDIFPQKVDITLTTSPPNLILLLDGQTIQTPYTFTSVTGITRSLEAPATQTPGGVLHTYTNWTDQTLAREFLFDTPSQDKNFTSIYQILVIGNGDGLKGEYRNTVDYNTTTTNGFASAPVLTRTDPTINFDWGYLSPSAAVTPEYFTVRWTGEILPQFNDTYQFFTTTEHGVRLWIDNVLLIDKWIWPAPLTEYSGTIRLEAGQRYKIKMEYFQITGAASAKLEWSSPIITRQVIPQTQLFSTPIPRRMVALGSSTTAGTGTNPVADSAWVSRFNYYYKTQLGIVDFTYNLGVGGTTPYKAMPSSFVNVVNPGHPSQPAVPDQPDPNNNVTKANSLLKSLSVPANGVVIVNFPTNGYDYMSIDEVMNTLQTIYDSATRTGNKCFITTTQPRSDYPFFMPSLKKKLALIKDAIIQRFGVNQTINFWDGMYNPADTTILPIYAYGDNIHFNNAGHKVLFDRVVAKNVFGLSLPNAGDYRSNVASSGVWGAASNWQVGNGSTWITATSPPGTSNKLITIKGGNRIDVTGDLIVNGSIMINILGTLSSGSNISLKGNWTNNGSFLAGTGTVTFNGTTAQGIDGTTATDFNNISVVNTTGIQVQSNQNLKGILTLSSNAVFDADGSNNTSIFKLLSQGDNPTIDAAVAALPTGAVVNGKVTVQRYMSLEGTNSRMYRYISSPVQNGTVSDIQNEIPITGPFTGSSGSGQSMYYYDETVITDTDGSGTADLNDGYIGFPSLTNSESLTSGRGYAMYVQGDVLSSAQWDIRGPIKQGNIVAASLPVTFTSSGNLTNDGWNLVGNPYASTIDWDATGWTKTNLDASIYFRDNGFAPSRVESWNGVVGTNGTTSYIATGQAFWVKTNGTTPVLSANENVKAPAVATTFFRKADPANVIRIKLAKDFVEDETVVHFREDATPAFDSHADAWKLLHDSFNLSTLSTNAERLSINSWSSLVCNTSITLSMDNVTIGNYLLKFSGMQSFENGVSFLLIDNFLNKTYSISDDQPHSFVITTDEKSKNSNRFTLHVDQEPRPVVIEERLGELTIGEINNIQWYLNEILIAGANSSILQPKESGTYSVIVNKNGCQLKGSYEFLVTGTEHALAKGLSIYPNPTKDEFFICVENGQPMSRASISNALGEKIGIINLDFSNGVSTGSFSLGNQASGMYFVSCPIGQKIVIVKIIKK